MTICEIESSWIGTIVTDRHDGHQGRALNEEYAEAEGQVRETDVQLKAIGDGGPTEDEVRDALQKLDPAWDELFPAEQRVVRLLIKEAVLTADGLEIAVPTNGLRSLTMELMHDSEAKPGEDGATVVVQVPTTFELRGGRKESILPPDAGGMPDVGPQRPIVVALARAYKWQHMLDSGEVKSLGELAARTGVDRSYISRIITLAALAPDIVATVLAGQKPSSLSLARLHRIVPVRWDEQRTSLGFPAV